MTRRHAFGLVAVAVLALAGCTPTASYVVQRTGEGVAIGIPRCTSAPIETLTLKGLDGEMAPQWSIRRTSDREPERAVFVVGEAPSGFEEVVPLEPEQLEDDDRLWPEVEPSFGGLGIVRLGDIPDDGQVYRVDVSGQPEPVGGLDVLDSDTLCGSDGGVVAPVAVVLVLAVVVAAGALVAVTRVRSRRARLTG